MLIRSLLALYLLLTDYLLLKCAKLIHRRQNFLLQFIDVDPLSGEFRQLMLQFIKFQL